LIKIPKGLLASGQPYQPDVRRLYWVRHPILDPHDPEVERPAVVVATPDDASGEIIFVTRSSTEKNGQFHPRQPEHGLNKDGWFTRVRSVAVDLWTPDAACSLELMLDEETFAYVLRDFDL
jgi:hypothetical protein